MSPDEILTGAPATAGSAYAGASQDAIMHHYDIGNEFWRLWLDSTLTYSCALWEDGDDLERGQRRKLDYMIDQARAGGAERVLDIGCGWGSLLRRLVERGSERVVGLTLSEAQRDWLSALDDPRIEVHLTSWSDYHSPDPYDAIVSIGAFEHFARLGLDRDEKVDAYREFFARCHELLAPGAWLSLQTIAKGDVPVDRQGMRDILLIVKRMFPESDLPHAADVLLAMEGWFEPVTLRQDREHYARTCAEWLAGLRANRDAAVAVAGEEVTALYGQYLEACVRQFERGHAQLLRFGMRRIEARPRPGFVKSDRPPALGRKGAGRDLAGGVR